jgi:hypothetical protein
MLRILFNLAMTLVLLSGLSSHPLLAHEVRPAVADIAVTQTDATIEIRLMLEPVIAGIDLAAIENTDDSALAAENDALRALPPAALRARFEADWETIAQQITFRAGDTALTPQVLALSIPDVGDTDLPRDSVLTLTSPLPAGDSAVIFGWDAALGGLALRQVSEGESYSVYLTNGALSDPLPRTGVAVQSAAEVIIKYVVSGFEHIIPLGIDHILFVLGLFFFSLAWRPLLWQVTAFTLAHTITLAVATLGLVTISPAIVEPLIAASIAYVAIENIFHKEGRAIGWSRIGIVFAFGLLHGLGFASVLGDFGLNDGQFVMSLVAFNVGVELGQLTVIAVAFLLVGYWFGSKSWYRPMIAVPVSAAIAVVGIYWAYERVFLG